MDDEEVYPLIFILTLLSCWAGWGVWIYHDGPNLGLVAMGVLLLMFTVAWVPPLLVVVGGVACVVGLVFLSMKAIPFLFHLLVKLVGPLLSFCYIAAPYVLCAAGIFLALGLVVKLLAAFLTLIDMDYPRARSLAAENPWENCALCSKCRSMTASSRIFGGNLPWWRVDSVEKYNQFYTARELQKSARACHLCALLWSSYDGYVPEQRGDASMSEDLGVEIRSTTRMFSDLQSVSIKLYSLKGDKDQGNTPLEVKEISRKPFVSSPA